MCSYFVRNICVIIFFLMLSGCGGSGVYLYGAPDDFNGNWNLSGKIFAKDNSFELDFNRDLSIISGKIYPEGGGVWDNGLIGNFLNIKINEVVQEAEVVSCGKVITSLDTTIMIQVFKLGEVEYSGNAVGIFVIDSECDGASTADLTGSLVMTRV